jgi:hypothetical protein
LIYRSGGVFFSKGQAWWRTSMKQMSLSKVAIAASTFTFATLLSFGWCEQRGVSLSVESAQARVGRPLTPVSVAGVARRQNRRAAYGYGAGAVGAGVAGAAAVGTAVAVGAATSPGWGWGGGPYYTGTGYTGTGYYGGGPYYRGGAWGAGYGAPYGRPMNANAFGGPGVSPVGWWGGVNSNDRALYIKNLHDAGYDPKNNFNANGNISTQ